VPSQVGVAVAGVVVAVAVMVAVAGVVVVGVWVVVLVVVGIGIAVVAGVAVAAVETIRRNKMKKLVSVTEVEGEGLQALLGERVLLMCTNYFYTGKLVGVNTDCVQLEDPAIVYETGRWSSKSYADEERLHVQVFYVQTAAIEAFGVSK